MRSFFTKAALIASIMAIALPIGLFAGGGGRRAPP